MKPNPASQPLGEWAAQRIIVTDLAGAWPDGTPRLSVARVERLLAYWERGLLVCPKWILVGVPPSLSKMPAPGSNANDREIWLQFGLAASWWNLQGVPANCMQPSNPVLTSEALNYGAGKVGSWFRGLVPPVKTALVVGCVLVGGYIVMRTAQALK